MYFYLLIFFVAENSLGGDVYISDDEEAAVAHTVPTMMSTHTVVHTPPAPAPPIATPNTQHNKQSHTKME